MVSFLQLQDDAMSDQSDLSASATEASSLVTVRAGCCNFNPVSAAGKRWHLVQMIMLPFIPIAALVVQNCWFMRNVARQQQEMKFLSRQVSMFGSSRDLQNCECSSTRLLMVCPCSNIPLMCLIL